jgi:hypothetical protein
MSTVQAWKPSPKYAAMFESAPVVPATSAQDVKRDWGFGARGVTKTWTPPATATVPSDWWKQDKSWVAA